MIVNNSLDEVKKRENALAIIKDWVLNKSRDSLYDLTGLSGGFIASPSELNLLETYLKHFQKYQKLLETLEKRLRNLLVVC